MKENFDLPKKESSREIDSQAEKQETRENDIENRHEMLERLIEGLLLEKAKKINEGNNAYIFEVSLDDPTLRALIEILREERLVALEDKDKVLDEESVVKMLKFYRSGSAKKEAHMQITAKNILEQNFDRGTVFVPDTVELKDHHILFNNNSTEMVSGKHHCRIPKETEFILMDKVDGVDLATWAYQESIIETHKSNVELTPDKKNELAELVVKHVLNHKLANPPLSALEDKDFQKRLFKAGGQVRFRLNESLASINEFIEGFPNKEFRDAFIDYFEIGKELAFVRNKESDLEDYVKGIYDDSILIDLIASRHDIQDLSGKERNNKILEILKETTGFKGKVPAHLFEDLKQAIKILNDNGFYHRDLHERNIMITNDGRIALIDFATAIHDERVTDPYTHNMGVGEKYYEDYQIVSPESLLFALTQQED